MRAIYFDVLQTESQDFLFTFLCGCFCLCVQTNLVCQRQTFFKGDPIFRPPHGLSMVISQSHRQVNVSVTIVVHTVLLYMYTTDLEAPKSISGQCHCQAVACCVVATKQLKVRLINKITGILASKFKRRRFVAMDSPQKGNDDFDRSLSLFSPSCATW